MARARRIWIGVITFLLVLVAGRSAAPAELTKAERPAWKVGDTWVRKQENGVVVTLMVKTVSDTGYVLSVRQAGEESEKEWHVSKELNLERIVFKGMNLETYAPGLIVFAWPLEVGKTWKGSYTSSSVTGPVNYEGRVVGVETVSTKAGTFEAFKIVRESEGISRGFPFRATLTYWYAPKAKANVKSDYTYKQIGALIFEAVEVKVSGD